MSGFDEWTIRDIAHVAGYFDHMSRLADSLGVELQAPRESGLREKAAP